MRTKSDAKRQAILDVAAQVFREMGFERASMSEISERVGGSKATLYNYFSSKEELFFEVMFLYMEAEFEANHRALDPAMEDVAEALRRFGEGMLTVFYSPPVLAARCLMVAESRRSELGRLCYARGPQRGEVLISEFLQAAMRAGKLRQADPIVVARHLRGLLESELLDYFLFNLVDTVSQAEIKAVVDRAIAVFMAAYGL